MANARSTIRPVGTTSGRTSFDPNVTSSAVPTDSSAENAKTADSAQPKPSMRMPARAGPTANPIGPDAPKIAIVVPSRARGVTSRMPASMIPVLPSWNPISSIARASCHGSRARATAANTTASTSALRTMTTLRLYLSAQAPHSGTSGIPTTKISALKMPMNASRSCCGDAHLAQVGRQQREDLADAEALDHRGDPEHRDEDPPVLGGAAVGGRPWRGGGSGGRCGLGSWLDPVRRARREPSG